jgi:hypothetical protein
MQTIEYRTQDKSGWGDGSWQDEPDKKQWLDQETGLPCLIVRNTLGVLCGYVGVPEGHWAYLRHYDDVPVDVHGGLTFSDKCQGGDETRAICHIADDDRVWWLGFDCAHAGDYMPKTESFFRKAIEHLPYGIPSDVYRDFAYVTQEVESLARQLKDLHS